MYTHAGQKKEKKYTPSDNSCLRIHKGVNSVVIFLYSLVRNYLQSVPMEIKTRTPDSNGLYAGRDFPSSTHFTVQACARSLTASRCWPTPWGIPSLWEIRYHSHSGRSGLKSDHLGQSHLNGAIDRLISSLTGSQVM